jgi:hypothetical protein
MQSHQHGARAKLRRLSGRFKIRARRSEFGVIAAHCHQVLIQNRLVKLISDTANRTKVVLIAGGEVL